MYCRFSIVLSLAMSVWQVSGSALETTPSSCIASCGPFQTASNTCNDASCFCLPAIANSLQQCMNCGLEGITDQTTLSNAEQLVSGYDIVCKGFNVPFVTINTSTGPTPIAPAPVLPTANTASHSGTSTSFVTSHKSSFSSTSVSPTLTSTSQSTSSASSTTIQQLTAAPSDDSSSSTTSAFSTNSSGTVTSGSTSGCFTAGSVDMVFLAMYGALSMVFMAF